MADLVCFSETLWSVRIDGADGPSLALNQYGGRYLSRHKKDAKKFCDELQEHIESRCTVVQVTVGFTEVPF